MTERSRAARSRDGVAAEDDVAGDGDARGRGAAADPAAHLGLRPRAKRSIAANGRYGPYVKKGKESRSLETEEQLFTVTLEEALALLAQPKARGRRAAAPPLKELGDDPV